MSRAEFSRWVEFYNREPFDDYSRHHRPAAMVAHMAGGGGLESLLRWMSQRHSTEADSAETSDDQPVNASGYTAADIATMRGLGMKPPPRKKV